MYRWQKRRACHGYAESRVHHGPLMSLVKMNALPTEYLIVAQKMEEKYCISFKGKAYGFQGRCCTH